MEYQHKMSKIRPLSSELAEEAYRLFQEDDTRIKMVLVKIKQWLLLQPHLRVRMDDQWLLAFARGCKYSMERIQKKIESYYSLKTEYSNVYRLNKDPNDPIMNYCIHSGSILVYNCKKNPAGPTIGVARCEYDHKKCSFNDALKYSSLVADVSLYENDNLAISGVILIIDLGKVTVSHMAQLSVGNIRTFMRMGQDGYPVRIKGIHLINAPLGFQTLIDIAKIFASEKLKGRIFVHSSLQDLYTFIPKDYLPNEYGGTAGSFDEFKEMWIRKFEKYRDWLIEDEQYYVDESLRLGKSKNDNSCTVM